MKSRVALVAAALAVLATLAVSSCWERAPEPVVGPEIPKRPQYETAAITVGGHPVVVEVADTEERRRYGCMFKTELPDDRGMLFFYPEAHTLSFWMRNVPIALDIAYLNDAGQILSVRRMEPYEEHGGYSSPGPVRIALELSAGWFERHGVKPMAWVKMPVELLTRRGEPDSGHVDNIPRILEPSRQGH